MDDIATIALHLRDSVLFLMLTRMVAADPLISICLALAVVAGLVALYWTATAWFHRWTTLQICGSCTKLVL